MALASCLIDLAKKNATLIELDGLAEKFYDMYADRIRNGKPQNAQFGEYGKATYAEQEIEKVNAGRISKTEAIEAIKKKSLMDMVLERFHALEDKQAIEFYRIDKDTLVLSPVLLDLFENKDSTTNLTAELLSRWDLLEHAFENMKNIEPVDANERLTHVVSMERRKNLTPLISVLSGYQQGRCFYCGEELYDIEVDHVIPYKAILNNHVWNLVLAHHVCNQSKNLYPPQDAFIENLIIRNEYYIHSAHPLKNTLIKQTGTSPQQRRDFIYRKYRYAKAVARNSIWATLNTILAKI